MQLSAAFEHFAIDELKTRQLSESNKWNVAIGFAKVSRVNRLACLLQDF